MCLSGGGYDIAVNVTTPLLPIDLAWYKKKETNISINSVVWGYFFFLRNPVIGKEPPNRKTIETIDHT